ncbi:MAG: DUF2130 domain-containing protein, partial [Clostridia bacterium]|nr:DUF2130 domain-containing protein [Clostridia bacterium]
MHEIKCPNCGQVFQVDETGYAEIVRQIHDVEFEKELEQRVKELEKNSQNDMRIAKLEQEKKHSEALTRKDNELSEKDKIIEQLRAMLNKAEVERKLAVTEAVRDKDTKLTELDTQILKLRTDIELQKKENELKENNLIEKQKNELKLRDEEIERLKDFKARQSTKMVGESLEQHCLTQFNQVRMMAFPNAYFEKDNDARTGSKGDFIYREASDGVEFISIMFEMKNEMDETATKHKNEDFYKELDRDRNEKNCEFAVLVSLLESDSEYFTTKLGRPFVDIDKKIEAEQKLSIPKIFERFGEEHFRELEKVAVK